MTGDDPLHDLLGEQRSPAAIEESARIYPLVGDSGNQRVLTEWIESHDSHQAVGADTPVTEAEFDLCIVDASGLKQHRDALTERKKGAKPVLLPVLLLLPEARTEVIDADGGAIADNVFGTTIDEIVSLPIRQAELEWRIKALLRLRSQSLNLQERTNTLRLFQRAVEDSGHAVYITDPEGQIKYVNPAFEEITGYTAEEVVGQTPRLLNSGEMPEAFFDELWETLRDGKRWDGEIVDRRKDGKLYYATQTIAPMVEDGETRAFVAVQTDITEQKEREERLERRTQAVEAAPIGVTITDPTQEDNPLIYANEAFTQLTGYTQEEYLGQNCRFLQGANTDPDRVARIREAVDAEKPVTVELRNYQKNGTEFWNRLSIAPVRTETGELISYVGFQQDVTERKQREQQLQVLGRVLRHNLRNEMSVIQSWAETLQAKTDRELDGPAQILKKTAELVELADKERLITEMLASPPQNTQTDLTALLNAAKRRVSDRYPDAQITITCPADATAVVSVEFERVIEELLTNAVIHNDESPAEVDVTVTVNDERTTVELRDTGPTIPEMDRAVLLGEVAETALDHGSGLGLWLVNLVVSRSGGNIQYEEGESCGNVVTLELPTVADGTAD